MYYDLDALIYSHSSSTRYHKPVAVGVNLCASAASFLFAFERFSIFTAGHKGEWGQVGGLGTELMIEANNVCNLFHCTMISRHFFFGDCSTFFVLIFKLLLSELAFELELEFDFDFDFDIVA